MAYLDKHSTIDLMMVSGVSSNATGGNFLTFFELLHANSGLNCKYDLIMKNSFECSSTVSQGHQRIFDGGGGQPISIIFLKQGSFLLTLRPSAFPCREGKGLGHLRLPASDPCPPPADNGPPNLRKINQTTLLNTIRSFCTTYLIGREIMALNSGGGREQF